MTTNNVMQQLRSPTTAAPASLLPGQLAYSNATGGSGVLYIGSTDGATVVPIAGVRTPGVLTANQALVANSTSGLNNVITGTLTLAGNSSVSGVIAANGTGNVGSGRITFCKYCRCIYMDKRSYIPRQFNRNIILDCWRKLDHEYCQYCMDW